MQYSEMARRLRHDLIKHLDLPKEAEILDPTTAQVLKRRLFDQGTGLCKMATVWGFKLRKDPNWSQELEDNLKKIELLSSQLQQNQSSFERSIIDYETIDSKSLSIIQNIIDAVNEFERKCNKLSETNNDSDTDEALKFFDFLDNNLNNSTNDYINDDKNCTKNNNNILSNPAHIPTTDNTSIKDNPQPSPIRVLVVDDHTMSVERLLSNKFFRQRVKCVTLCQNQNECVQCDSFSNCNQKRARTFQDVLTVLRNKNKAVDVLLMDVRFDALDTDELLWIPEIPSLNTEESVKALQGLIIARRLRRMPEFSHIPIVLMTARSRLPNGATSLLHDLEGLQFVDDDASIGILVTRLESVVRMGHETPVEQGYFWGSSPGIQNIRRQVEMMSQGTRTVFITGPSGSGKSSLVENIIYPLSGRSRLVTLDLSSVPDTLVESELFGHVKGAYSGATHDRTGLIEEADGGILFLDEIGNLSLENQRKLLLFLQDKVVRRIGAAHETRRHVDVKVVVATHLDLADEVSAGRFRFDLYMRLGPAMRVALPSLAERREDLPSLIETLVKKIVSSDDMKPYFNEINKICREKNHIIVDFGKGINSDEQSLCVRFKQPTAELMMNYKWPGNTRELESALDTLILKAFYDLHVSSLKSRIIEIDHYYALSLLGGLKNSTPIDETESRNDDTPIYTKTPIISAYHLDVMPDFADLRRTLESRYLCEMYESCNGDLGLMGQKMFGDDSDEMRHKIMIRMNQLGISLRQLKRLGK